LISGSVLLLGFFFLGPIYQFKNENEGVVDNGLKVMTFNVRGFNQMGQLDNSDINNLILNFIETENPDIVCMQEAPHFLKNPKKGHLKKYNHKFIDFIYGREQNRSILSVHSKYPILNKCRIHFLKREKDLVKHTGYFGTLCVSIIFWQMILLKLATIKITMNDYLTITQ